MATLAVPARSAAVPVFEAARCEVANCDDTDELAQACLHWRIDIVQTRPAPFSGVITLAQGDYVQLGFGTYAGHFQTRGQIPPRCVSLLLAGGRSPPISYGRPIQALDAEVLTCARAIDYASTGDCGVFAISIEAERFGLAASAALGSGWTAALCHGRLRLRGLRERRLLMLRLFRKLRAVRRRPGLLADGNLRRLWEHAIVRDVLAATAAAVRTPPLPQRSRIAALAEEYMRAQAFRPMSVLELAAAIGTSERALYLGFNERFGMSPVAYAKAMRLNGARRDLRRGDYGTVTDIALRWGFLHLGRFASDYRAFFGESPSDTRLHAAALPNAQPARYPLARSAA